MTPAAAAAPSPRLTPQFQYTTQVAFLRKDARRKNKKIIIILCQWGYTEKNFYFYKNNFSFIYQWGYTGKKNVIL